jgi:nicotinamidase-related amidase/type 1 glutamine amidotransferase
MIFERRSTRLTRFLALLITCLPICTVALAADPLKLELRYQEPTAAGASRFHRLTRAEQWSPQATAVIVCDMWDSHHCVNAVRRVLEVAPRMDQFVRSLRAQGVAVIHAPSSCMAAYENHPGRLRAQTTPMSKNLPSDIGNWCDRIPSEEAAAYPVDQSEGGEDDDLLDHQQWALRLKSIGRNPKSPWLRQCDAIHIDDKLDYISDSGQEIWSILENKQIQNVMLVGVHTNMCVLGRPFGLRQMASNGKKVVLVRDLTDTMYDPNAWPYVSHFTGTDLIVQHIERFVCPTIASNQIIGGNEFRFQSDRRPRLAILMAEDEYKTEETLPKFAAEQLGKFSVNTIFGSETQRNHVPGLESIDEADALLVSVRRRPLTAQQLKHVQNFVAKGKPMIGIRTASHAFSLRDKQPDAGLSAWPEFDASVWGGNYTNHFGNDIKSTVRVDDSAAKHSILAGIDLRGFMPGGSLYKTAPLGAGTQPLLFGKIAGEPEQPVAWTFIRSDGGRSFYISLGHKEDFAQAQFIALLSSGIHWACGLPSPTLDTVQFQATRYAAGHGKQRK